MAGGKAVAKLIEDQKYPSFFNDYEDLEYKLAVENMANFSKTCQISVRILMSPIRYIF